MFPILSLVLLSPKINNIFKSILKGSEVSLFVDDFALCIPAKYLPHAKRLMQLCDEDWVYKNCFNKKTYATV